MIHALITIIVCCLCNFACKCLTGAYCPDVCIPIACFYIGREIAQAEYRYIERYCGRHRVLMPWYAVFTLGAWTLKSVLDWLLPCIAAVVCASIFTKVLV